MVFVRSGGVQGHGMDHTKRFPQTWAGFGLTVHGGSRFPFFGEMLETSGIQIGSRICFKARVPSQELSNKLVFQKMTLETTYFPGNWTTSQDHRFLIKWLPLLCLFYPSACTKGGGGLGKVK